MLAESPPAIAVVAAMESGSVTSEVFGSNIRCPSILGTSSVWRASTTATKHLDGWQLARKGICEAHWTGR